MTLGVVKVKRGETVVLPGGQQLTFVAHGHKRTRVGERSPLMVSAKLDGRDANVSIDDGERVFELGGLTFELLSHGYDAYTELRCFGRVER